MSRVMGLIPAIVIALLVVTMLGCSDTAVVETEGVQGGALDVAAEDATASAPSPAPTETPRSVELPVTDTEFPESGPLPAVEPPAPDLETPEAAVRSYLMWLSYAYLTRDSNSLIDVLTDAQWKRASEYISLNYSKGRAIDQRCVEFTVHKVRVDGSMASVNVRERWLYRYVNTSGNSYSGPAEDITYDCLYELKYVEGEGWLVAAVDANTVDGAAN